ncbi:MAG: phosphoglucosamine mutase, partial [Proteiniphilum sp.]
MTLIKSISGIRGTIGGAVAENLTPFDILKFTAAYALFIKKQSQKQNPTIVVGRDARISGEMVHRIITGTLIGMGCDVIDIGMATTPTTEIAVEKENASGGIIITASHNPKQWNALKLLNGKGEFLNAAEGEEILSIAESEDFLFSPVDELGKITQKQYLHEHIRQVLALDLVDKKAVEAANFRVAIDCVNSVGGVAIPELLYALGVKEIFKLHCAPHGNFSHNPEPLPQHLTELASLTRSSKASVGFAVDPDV